MAENGFGLTKIGQIAVMVKDLERAVGFYRDVLGMRFLFQVPNMAFFDLNGLRLMLGIPETEEFDHPASIVYYDVGDIQAAHDALKTKGVEFRTEPQAVADLGDRVLWLAFFKDSEANPLCLMSEVRKAA
jgi:predicted enzyme related to lactoylglutathione lyase